jgi:LAO/AO transport system kinase
LEKLSEVIKLSQETLRGNKRSIARVISLIEDGLIEAKEAISILYQHTGKAHIIGVTGPPGVGKSSLIEKLIKEIRHRGQSVGVVAIDPTSPFSGGAFLGDRVRMQSLSTDDGVFIRSMATRGSLGGVARATKDVVKVLDAAGMNFVMVETVGAGQSEVEVIKFTETVVVVLSPMMGDEIQTLKAGMMEIGDIFVVNKSDLPNSDNVVVDIKSTLTMERNNYGWVTPIFKTVATTGEGVKSLLEGIIHHGEYSRSSAYEEHHRQRVGTELLDILNEKITERMITTLQSSDNFEEAVDKVLNREIDPYTAADELLEESFALNFSKKNGKIAGLERGLIQLYTGKGKGKTSAAFGLALRAIGRGFNVYMIQFIKGGFDYGELHIAEKLPNFKLVAFGRGQFINKDSPAREDIEQAQLALEHAKRVLQEGSYNIVILDEINVAMTYNLISIKDVLELISKKPEKTELVLTGREAPEEIIEIADLVTKMEEIKHPFKKGIKARIGIEY